MAKANRNKPFKDWLYEEVELAYGLTRLRQHPFFDFIKTLSLPNDDARRPKLEQLRLVAFDYVESWNEDEYKFMFISSFIGLAEFISPNFKVFTQRQMQVKYENGTKTTEGLVEFMLAKGLQTPKKPYFFLHEYKPEKRRDNDPLGQLLIAMVAAQIQNEDNKELYGIYVNGRNWFFVVLDGKNYAVSNPFVITDKDIFDLFAILLYFKDFMEERYSAYGV
jgi:hypothetical protein